MCTERKRMGMVMGEAKAVQPAANGTPVAVTPTATNPAAAQEAGKTDIAARIEQRIAEDEEATVEIPAGVMPLAKPEEHPTEDTAEDAPTEAAKPDMPTEPVSEDTTYEDKAEESAPDDAPAVTDKKEEAPAKEVQAIVIEASEMHVICPLVIQMGARVAEILDLRVEMGDFENDEDDILIALLKKMYRTGQYAEALALLEMTFLMNNTFEAAEFINVVQGMGDAECCRLFMNGFINGSSRTEFDAFRIRRWMDDGNDEVSKDE